MQPCPGDAPLPVLEAHPLGQSLSSSWPWIILLSLLGVLAFYEIWGPAHGLPSITEWMRQYGGWRKWLRVIGGTALIVVAIWHLVFGGPL